MERRKGIRWQERKEGRFPHTYLLVAEMRQVWPASIRDSMVAEPGDHNPLMRQAVKCSPSSLPKVLGVPLRKWLGNIGDERNGGLTSQRFLGVVWVVFKRVSISSQGA